MTVMVAHEMGYVDQLNITFSQSGYLDFSIAQQIAIDLHHEWLFKPLDGGDFIIKNNFLTQISYGSGCILGHGYSMEKLINYDDFGIIHTGQLGDVVIGTYLKKMEYKQSPKITDGAYSQELCERLESYKLKYQYEDSELFMMYNRGFCGIGQGLLTFQENSESHSPFTDVDFFEFCYSIPLEYRFNHKIYIDWILSKYPRAAEYIWENIQRKIQPIKNKKVKTMHIAGYEVPHFIEYRSFFKYVKGFIYRRLGIIKKGQKAKTIVQTSKYNMNPIDYWYNTNPMIKLFMEKFWGESKEYIPDSQLKNDMTHLYEDCVVYDKLQCLSVLSAIKMITSK
jgi:asparagine synthase (glutamine-hydrolysing)